MLAKDHSRIIIMTVFLYTSCSQIESKITDSVEIEEDQNNSDIHYVPVDPESAFTHKMIKSTEENLFSSLAYECSECTFAQHMNITAPEGWTKGPHQVSVFSSGELRSLLSFDDVPSSVDFIPEVPGEEYVLIAKNLDAEILQSGSSGVVVEAQVMRDTIFYYDVGVRVHELTDPEDRVFVLFAYQVDPIELIAPDFQESDLSQELTVPSGWVYSSRILDEELIIDTADVATVLAIRTDTDSTWQMR